MNDVVGPVLIALSDPTRRLLLDALADEGTASATTLAGRLPVSRQAVVKHLHVLEEAGPGARCCSRYGPSRSVSRPAGSPKWPPSGTAGSPH